jgi:methylmalonyl-CoA/ethylmalonyl-CoA epimerase
VGTQLKNIDHVAIAVEDLETATTQMTEIFGLAPSHRERVEDQGVEEVMFDMGGSSIQLLGALGPDTPVGRFLQRRGPGLHHIAYRVDDIGSALDDLRARGVRLIDETGRPGSRGTTIAFVHPEAMSGVLTELVQI